MSPSGRRIKFALPLLLAALLAGVAVAWLGAASQPVVTTDKPEYFSNETVTVTGIGFSANTTLDVPVIRPDGSIVTGDGTSTPGWDTVLSDGSGSFTYFYKLDGISGVYEVRVYLSPWSGSLAEIPLATTTFSDPLIKDFKQCANLTGDCDWVQSILQSSNSIYFENMSVPQRMVFTEIDPISGNLHTLTFSHEATKGGIHAYDWLTSYDQAIASAAALGTPYNDLIAQACDPNIGPPTPELGATCAALRSGGFSFDVVVPDDPFISKDGSTQDRINAYEATFGNRTIKIFGNSSISSASLSLSHSVTNGGDTGDSDVDYTLTWTSASTEILIEVGAHIAKSGLSADAWGPGLGASNISGGPYHVRQGQLDGSPLGSLNNQIKGADIQIVPGTIIITKDAVPNGPQDFSFTDNIPGCVVGPLDDDADGTLSNMVTCSNLAPGTFTVTETDPTPAFNLTGLSCTDPDNGSTTNIGTRTAIIDLDPGETVTCTFTNTEGAPPPTPTPTPPPVGGLLEIFNDGPTSPLTVSEAKPDPSLGLLVSLAAGVFVVIVGGTAAIWYAACRSPGYRRGQRELHPSGRKESTSAQTVAGPQADRSQARRAVQVAQRAALVFAVVGLLAASIGAGLLFTGFLSGDSTSSYAGRAAIIDQLSLTQPNSGFVDSATHLLEGAGYEVDYYSGERVTVNLFRYLPAFGYDVIVFRVHTGITNIVDEAVGSREETDFIGLFTGEPYVDGRHPEQLTGGVGRARYYESDPPLFGITTSFLSDSIQGSFDGAQIIMMGCDGLRSSHMAEAFLGKGASSFVGWSKPVSAPHTDVATERLLELLLSQGLEIEDAVRQAAAEIGPDPFYGGELRVLGARGG